MAQKTSLSISRDQPLPFNAVTQTFAFIARRGAGKTYAAMKLAEQMLLARMQIIPIDPVGNWYGLRLGADGKSRGFDIPVFGGEHGDLPLAVGAGALIADLVVDRNISVVLDVSSFRKGERKTFVTDFAEQFFHRKKTSRTPVHVFVEEAQVFVPERPAKGEERMLGAFVDLVRLGRNYGIGVSLISQRPQSVSKEALNQTEALLVLQTGGAHERKALADWIVYQGIESKDVLNEVPSLPAGTAYLWSPQWLGVLKKIKISKKVTFDASATPELGAVAVEPKSLAPVDLQAIREAMKTVVEEAKANDPRLLKAEIAALKKQMAGAPKAVATPAPPNVIEHVVVEKIPVFKDGEVKRLEAAVATLAKVGAQLVTAGETFKAAAAEVSGALQAAAAPRPAPPTRMAMSQRPAPAATPVRIRGPVPAPAPAVATAAGELKITPALQRILDALAWLESGGQPSADKRTVAILAGASPISSAYTNNCGTLRTAGLIDYPLPRMMALTGAGRALAHAPEGQITTADLHERLFQSIRGKKAEMLRVLIQAYPDSLSYQALAEQTGMSPSSSSFTNMRGELRGLGLIDYPDPGHTVALPVLFLEN